MVQGVGLMTGNLINGVKASIISVILFFLAHLVFSSQSLDTDFPNLEGAQYCEYSLIYSSLLSIKELNVNLLPVVSTGFLLGFVTNSVFQLLQTKLAILNQLFFQKAFRRVHSDALLGMAITAIAWTISNRYLIELGDSVYTNQRLFSDLANGDFLRVYILSLACLWLKTFMETHTPSFKMDDRWINPAN